MLYNIVTGHGGLTMRARSEIVVLMSSLDHLKTTAIEYVIADRNAALAHANFGVGANVITALPWQAWRDRTQT